MQWSKSAKIDAELNVEGSKLVYALSLLLAAGCAKAPAPVEPQAPAESRRVLVVWNSNSRASEEIARYYVEKRKIPSTNVVKVSCAASEDMDMEEFVRAIQNPVKANIKANRNQIDFIVLTKGVPIRLKVEQQYSVDAWLAAADLPLTPITQLTEEGLRKSLNPYFNSSEPFSSKKMGFYLVTRLDGYTVEQCKNLVDRSLMAKPEKGPFFFDEAGNRKDPAYKPMQDTLTRAADVLGKKGFQVERDTTDAFIAPDKRLAGYASWGSNDGAFKLEAYKQLKFKPGALVETFVSTSGRTFNPTQGGQSLIADLIANGVTGIKGYVSEPYTFALAKPDILFNRYTSGMNLAESFYSASQFLKWKDVVVGDPLCAPYRK